MLNQRQMNTESKLRWHGMTWYLYYSFIKWQIQRRNENDRKVQAIHPSLNISIIASCCAVIEGFLFTTIKDYWFFSRPKNETEENLKQIYNRQLEDYLKQLENASYTRYLDLFKVFTGLSISETINPKTYKAIKKMFEFRNCLLHGNEIDLNFIKSEETRLENVEVHGKYKKILEYGDENNLIVLDFAKGEIDLLTNKFIDHFYCHTTKFICEVFENIPEPYRERLSTDIFSIKENLKECDE